MSVKIMGLIWDYEIPRDEKFVLLAYADHASHDGTNIFPSVETIAKKTGYSERSVQTITRKLQNMGLLIQDGKGAKGTNKWRIPMEWGAEFAPENSAGVQKSDGGGAESKLRGVQPAAPESLEPSLEPSVKEAKPKASEIPELVLFKNIALTYCKPNQRDLVIDAVRKIENRIGHFPTVADLKPFWDQWRLVSGNPYNLTWLVEWAVNGKKQGVFQGVVNKAAAAVKQNASMETIHKWLDGTRGGLEVIDGESV